MNINAEKTVELIIADLCGRSGGDHFYEGSDSDIQQEIKDKWVEIIKYSISQEKSVCDKCSKNGIPCDKKWYFCEFTNIKDK